MAERWFLDPQETLIFEFDWAPLVNGTGDTDWLDQTNSPVETISSYLLTVDSPGPTVESSAISTNSTKIQITLSVGGATVGNWYDITCQITTSQGQVAERTASVKIKDK